MWTFSFFKCNMTLGKHFMTVTKVRVLALNILLKISESVLYTEFSINRLIFSFSYQCIFFHHLSIPTKSPASSEGQNWGGMDSWLEKKRTQTCIPPNTLSFCSIFWRLIPSKSPCLPGQEINNLSFVLNCLSIISITYLEVRQHFVSGDDM